MVHLAGLLFTPVDGHDADSHLTWLPDFAQQIGAFNWYPRWSYLSLRGFGAPIFYFYPPLTYFIAGVLFLTLHVTTGTALFKGVSIVAYLVSMMTCWICVRSLGANWKPALLASLFYATSPYRFHTLYSRSALPEDVAYAIIPLIFWAVIRLSKTRTDWAAFLCLSFSLSGLLLTDIPVACMMYLLGLVYLIRVAMTSWKTSATIFSACVLGAGGAGILLIPAWYFKAYLTVTNYVHPGDHSPISEIWDSGLIVNRTLLPLLFLTSLIFGIRLLLLNSNRSPRGPLHFNWESPIRWIFIVSLLLQLPAVFTFLSNVGLPFTAIQFPWRLDTLFMLFLTFGVARIEGFTFGGPVVFGLIGSTLLTAILVLSVIFHFRAGEHVVQSDSIRPEYQSIYMSNSMDSLSKFLKTSGTNTIYSSNNQIVGKRLANSFPYAQSFSIDLKKRDTVRLNLYYWPTWRISISGRDAPSFPDKLGRTLFVAPSGFSIIRAHLHFSKPELFGLWVTLGSLLATVVVTFFQLGAERRLRLKHAFVK